MRLSGAILQVAALAVALLAEPLRAQGDDATYIKANYTKQIHDIAMRDGVKLHTIVYVPRDAAPGRT